VTTDVKILIGDVRAKLREIQDNSVQCVVTSPPYWGLRDYGTPPQVWGGSADCVHSWGESGTRHRGGPPGKSDVMEGRDQSARAATGDIATGCFCQHCGAWRGELGLEPTPELFVEHIVEVFREVKRVLKKDGTCWVNMGDCYASGAAGTTGRGPRRPDTNGRGEEQITTKGYRGGRGDSTGKHGYREDHAQPNRAPIPGLKPKDLVGQPWRVAFALQADGWWLRQDIIWAKPNPMPESVHDRCTKSHEYLFLLSKSAKYYFNAAAIKEPVTGGAKPRGKGTNPKSLTMPAGWAVGPGSHSAVDHNKGPRSPRPKQNASFSAAVSQLVDLRNKRSVWFIPTEPYPEAHYATFPSSLVRPCVLAGSKPGDTVLDPFGGSGTTAAVAHALGRAAMLIDLNPANESLMRARILRGLIHRKTRKPRRCDSLELPLEGAA
jgi:DNA modification methylase